VSDERQVPSQEDIERAYRRPLPGPSKSPWVRFAYSNQRKTRRSMKVFMAFWLGILGLFCICAALDVFGHLGWGYQLKDVYSALLLMIFGLLFWGLFALIQEVVSGITKRAYGPDPSEHRQDDKVS